MPQRQLLGMADLTRSMGVMIGRWAHREPAPGAIAIQAIHLEVENQILYRFSARPAFSYVVVYLERMLDLTANG
jgi:hypothetical protein